MAIEIKIGREERGKFDITVPAKWTSVSKHHAKVIYENGVATFYDNSSNGSFVNGRPVVSTTIKKSDVIRLGGYTDADCQVNMEALFNLIKKAEEEFRTDYSKEFIQLRCTYEKYKKELIEANTKKKKDEQLPRLIATLIPAIVGVVILILPIPGLNQNFRFVILGLGTVITTLMGIITLGKNTDNTDEITEIQIKYQKDYKCPKCGKDIPLSTHWRKLEELGECPHKCGAKFKV